MHGCRIQTTTLSSRAEEQPSNGQTGTAERQAGRHYGRDVAKTRQRETVGRRVREMSVPWRRARCGRETTDRRQPAIATAVPNRQTETTTPVHTLETTTPVPHHTQSVSGDRQRVEEKEIQEEADKEGEEQKEEEEEKNETETANEEERKQ